MARLWGLIGVGFTLLAGGMALIFQSGNGLAAIFGWVLLAGALASFVAAGISDRRRSAMADEDRSKKQVNVTSFHQSGGITAGELNITAPQPSVHAQEEATNEKTNEGYATRIGIHLDAPYAAQNLAVAVRKTAVKSLKVRPRVAAAMIGFSEGPLRDGGQLVVIDAPLHSDYEAVVVTEQPENLAVEVALNLQ